MHRIIGIIAAASAILGFLSLAYMFYGSTRNIGMAVLFFQVWGVILSIAAICLGILSRLMARRSANHASQGSDVGIGLGLGCMLALLIVMIFFG